MNIPFTWSSLLLERLLVHQVLYEAGSSVESLFFFLHLFLLVGG